MNIEESDFVMIEKFIVLLYDQSLSSETVNAARKYLFMHKNIHFDALRPTFTALTQHIFRAIYQAIIIWGQALEQQPVYLSPENWGWRSNGKCNWDIYWTELSAISDVCSELCKCACKNDCGPRCSGKKSNLQCTSICSCSCI